MGPPHTPSRSVGEDVLSKALREGSRLRVAARVDHQDLPPAATVTKVRVLEGLSKLFDVWVELLCEDAELDLRSMLWTSAAVTLTPRGGASGPRSFHGTIEQAKYLGTDMRLHRYGLRLRPTVHGLKYRVRTRIFQEKNAVDIIKQVLSDAGIQADATRWDTTGTYPERVYCTQWKESELDFVLRLLEDEGIFYWFEHTDIDHTLCFGDSRSSHESIEDPFIPILQHASLDREGLWQCVLETKVVHDKFASRDWNFEEPTEAQRAAAGDEGIRELYEYPGGYESGGNGSRLAQIRLHEAQHDQIVLRAKANVGRVTPGSKLELVDVYPQVLAGEYVVLDAEHRFDLSEQGAGGGDDGQWEQTLRMIPAEFPFRPPRITRRPKAHGLESAVVTGPSGEEIHVDQHGRIKVHFYWDRENAVDDTASCWIRVQQLNTQGAMILPRVGWEVHVAFIDGDPDRPVALHKAYNAETMPPYGLPANKTQSALQSSTSPGGGSTNEIRLQDGNGGMEWFMHASKDLNTSVANDQNETVGVDATESVGQTMTVNVGADESGSIGGNQSMNVTVNAQTQTGGAKSVTIGGNDDWGIKSNFGFESVGARTETIGGLMNVLANTVSETFNSNHTRSVGAVQVITCATGIAETVGGSKTETVSAAKAIITPKEYAEAIGGVKTLTSGAVMFKTGGDVGYAAKGAVALTAAGIIDIKCGEDAMFSGSQVRVTCGTATFKGGGGEFKLGGSITIDAKNFGGESGPMLKIQGNIDYKD